MSSTLKDHFAFAIVVAGILLGLFFLLIRRAICLLHGLLAEEAAVDER